MEGYYFMEQSIFVLLIAKTFSEMTGTFEKHVNLRIVNGYIAFKSYMAPETTNVCQEVQVGKI
jgi:hypothetical protein